jgi:glycosyltransferase involved in cell wall biosynthesis
LAKRGETVHVISKKWHGAESDVEEQHHGRLVIHRIPYEDWASLRPHRPHPALTDQRARNLFGSNYPAQCFSWCASLLAERLVEEAAIEVIEAEEYQAPLYYFQLRRVLGMGPRQRPPCIVHLHSPTELIAKHNDWSADRNDLPIAVRLENFSIATADALICPSQYLAGQVQALQGFAAGTIRVIPYPLGDTCWISRSADVWRSGTIVFAGRLEPRKGVHEWLDAAIAAAREERAARFVFVGADTFQRGRSVRSILQRRIPRDLKARFTFSGEVTQSRLMQIWSGARMAVVPSRWENLPHVCLEAMSTGLPVIASPEGGMAEMIQDGMTGWLARRPDAAGLAEALHRALATPVAKLAAMSAEAAASIRRLCDSDTVASAQLAYRTEIVGRGPSRSLRLPVELPVTATLPSDEPIRHTRERIATVKSLLRYPRTTAYQALWRLKNKLVRRVSRVPAKESTRRGASHASSTGVVAEA